MSIALRNLTYRRLLLAQILSVLGSGLTTIALGLLAFELAGNDAGVVLGAALAVKMIAYVGIAPVAAAISARLPRKGFLIGLDLVRAAMVLVLPFVSEIWQIYVLVFGFQACSAAFTPTFQAIIPDVLEDEAAYTQALSLSRLTYDLEALLGPMIAGLFLAVASFHALFAATSVGYLLSALLVWSVSLPAISSNLGEMGFRKRLTRGLSIYLSTPRLRGMLALYVAVAMATSMVIVNTVVHVKAVGGQGDGQVALYFAASGLGSMLVALGLPRILGDHSPRKVMLLGGAGIVLALALATGASGGWEDLLIWAALGGSASMVQTPSGLVVTRSCQPADRASLFAAQFTLSHATWLIAYPLAGYLGRHAGLSATFAGMAVLALIAVFAAARLWPRNDGFGPTATEVVKK